MKIQRPQKWQHADSKVRLKALADPLLEQSSIATMANFDTATEVRIAAIKRLESESELLSLVLTGTPPEIIEEATARLIECYSANNHLPETILPASLLLAIAQTGATPELRLEGVSRIQSEADLMTLLSHENHSKVWQQCARQLEQTSILEQVYKDFQSRDKSVLHIVKDKLQQRQDQNQANERHSQACRTTALALIKLSENPRSTEDQRRFNLLQSQWLSLVSSGLASDLDPTLKADADTAVSRNQAEALARQQDHAQQVDLADSLIKQLEQLNVRLLTSSEGLDSLAGELDDARSRWPVGLQDDASSLRYHALLAALENLSLAFSQYQSLMQLPMSTALAQLTQATQKLHWPENFPRPTALDSKLQDIQDRSALEQQQQAALAENLSSLDKQLEELGILIVGGQLKPATRLHSAIGKKLDSLPVEVKTNAAFSSRVEQQQAHAEKLLELKDWLGFATNPKRIELCEQMEVLHDTDSIAPEEKAKAIKELQDQWKLLGSSDSREGQKLWSRFKRASDKAYAPCAEFFKQQRATREENLKSRQTICASLEMFEMDHHWETADWKGVSDIIQQAQNQWREYNDVPRHKLKKLQERFTNIISTLRNRLRAEQERNHESKRPLIQQIETLLANDAPAAELVEITKRNQRAWQNIGISDRRVDQKLWQQFRIQCDLVFERRDAAITITKQAVNATKQEALQVYERLDRLVKEDTVDRGQIQQLQQQFRQIDLDRNETKLRKDFDSLAKRANQVIKSRAANQVKASLGELRRLAQLCQALELPGSDRNQLLQAWDGEVDLPDDWRQRIEHRRDRSAATDDQQLSINIDKAESLCVRIEILAGLDSPPEAQQRRMQYQVERLKRELSQGLKEIRSPDEQLREIQIDWYCLGGLPASHHRLYSRFNHAEAKLGFA